MINKYIDFEDIGKPIPNKILRLVNNKHAWHKLGYVGRPESNVKEYILIHHEKDDYYIGSFIEGFGFINVHFLKEDCINLTDQEKKHIEGMKVVII